MFLTAVTVGMLSSCAAIKRVFSADNSKSNLTPEELALEYKPHGTLEAVFHPCSVDGPSKRRMMVYLPEGYNSSEDRYPTAYILHGARGNETSWLTEGRLLQIVDSLTHYHLIEPMIYVLPNMNSYETEEEAEKSTFKKPVKAFLATNGAVETGFMNDVVGYVDSHYRTIPQKNFRAIAGLSVGGFQTIYITADSPDSFDYIGLFSSFFKSPVAQGKYKDFFSKTAIWDKTEIQFSPSKCPQLYYILIGKFDIFYMHSEYMQQYLGVRGFKYEYTETDGGHNWTNWQKYISIYLQEVSHRILIQKYKEQ